MRLVWDQSKRELVLAKRGLDFAEAEEVFQGLHFDFCDRCVESDAEARTMTFGFLGERLVTLVWSHESGARRIVAMRYADDREPRRFESAFRRMDRPG